MFGSVISLVNPAITCGLPPVSCPMNVALWLDCKHDATIPELEKLPPFIRTYSLPLNGFDSGICCPKEGPLHCFNLFLSTR